jgi:hypothetical protein
MDEKPQRTGKKLAKEVRIGSEEDLKIIDMGAARHMIHRLEGLYILWVRAKTAIIKEG